MVRDVQAGAAADRRRRARYGGPLGAILCVLGVLCGPALAETPRARLMVVEPADTALERVFFGRVKARQTIDLAFQVGGQILELPIDEGQPIAQGDLIAALDLEPFELNVARAQAQFDQAQASVDRLSQLSGSSVSRVTVDDARTALELARIALRDAERALRLATLRAPFDGIVARRSVPNFTTIAAGTPVVRLHDMSDLRIEIEVPEVLFQQAGRDPDVVLEAEFPAGDRRYSVAFREVTAETTQVGQAFRLTVGTAPPEGLFLLPGSSATVHARVAGIAPPILVPTGALVFDPEGTPAVMLFEPAGAATGTVRRREVELRPALDGAVQIVSGLAPGDEIVSAGAALLEDGASVIRFDGFAR